MSKKVSNILDFLYLTNKLKRIYRFSEIKGYDWDSVAAHSWRLGLMILVFKEELNLDIDLTKCMKLALTHDLSEALYGDIDAILTYKDKELKAEKKKEEKIAIKKVVSKLPSKTRKEIHELWLEYEMGETKEAKIMKALDKMEALMELNEATHKFFDDYDFIGIHGNKEFREVPEIQEIFKIFKNDLKKEYKKAKKPWKKSYNDYK